MRDLGLLAARTVVGGYLAAHGAQKLFGVLGGHGIEGTGNHFASIGLTPGKEMAMLAGGSELAGGVLTAAGAAHPLGPVALTGAMATATVVHRRGGPFAANGGFELPLTNLAAALGLALAGPGAIRLGPKLPARLAMVTTIGAAALTAYAVQKLLSHKPTVAEELSEMVEDALDVATEV